MLLRDVERSENVCERKKQVHNETSFEVCTFLPHTLQGSKFSISPRSFANVYKQSGEGPCKIDSEKDAV